MHFDLKLWRLTAGLRDRIAWSVLSGPDRALRRASPGSSSSAASWPACSAAIRGATCAPWLLATAGAILLRSALDHARTMVAHNTAARVQEVLRARLFDKILALGPAWFGAERTGGVMLSMVDGVEQLQTFFGQYLPQVAIALCAPIAIFCLHRLVGPSRRRRHAGRGVVHAVPARDGAPQDQPRVQRPAATRSSRSVRNSSTRCRACRP